MENKKLRWCLRLKDGIRIMKPNERIAKSYLEEAKSSLHRAEKDFAEGDLLWATVVIYYADYYALYSLLQKIGMKCENHFCSILLASFLLGEESVKTINIHKDKRIDAQYYMKVGKEEDIKKMLEEAKVFVSNFDELVSNINEEEIESYRSKMRKV